MHRSVVSGLVSLGVAALVAAIGACAEAPADDLASLNVPKQEQEQTEPTTDETNSAKLPASSNPAKEDPKPVAKDAGAPKDASTPPQDSGPPPPPPSTGICPADPIYDAMFLIEENPVPCPCSTGQCCYQLLGMDLACLDEF